MKRKRSGEHITVIGSVRNAKDVTVFVTLPVAFSLIQDIAFPAIMITGGVNTNLFEVTLNKDGGIFVNAVQRGSAFHIAISFLI
ncbi:TPA: hypothetical protein QCY38_004566 [Bacillus toyonensis]|uniref:hypothetical protein n=1 Tax=Bacillus cereus group TaxID=86661 RepID=UPI00321A0EEA|nr:hypothetical protein [Bacillus toyonensis]